MNSLSTAALAALVNHYFDFIMLSSQDTDFVIGSNGHAGLSNRKAGELLSISHTTINTVIETGKIFTAEETQMITECGFQGGNLVKLAQKFAASQKVKEETRKKCLDFLTKAATIGAQMFIDKMAGIPVSEANQTPQMLPEQRVQVGMNFFQVMDIDIHNPRIKQGIQDWGTNLLLHQPQLPSSSERWMGVAERAEELGYGRVGADHGTRTRLGQHVAKRGLEPRQEKRLCNGMQREIWIYRVCNELDEVIKSYFDVHLL